MVNKLAIVIILLLFPALTWSSDPYNYFKYYSLSKDEILDDPISWAIEEKGVNYKVRSQVVVERDALSVQKRLPGLKDTLFVKIFPWPLTAIHYDGEQKLTASLPLQTGKPYDLDFQVLDDLNDEFYDVYYTLAIPTLSKIVIVLSSWEMTVRVEPHPRFSDLTIIRVNSNTVINDFFLGLEGAKEKLKIKEVSEKIRRDLPQQLVDLKTFLENL